MKKLITILAVLGALCGPGWAADLVDWFDAGIGKNWPTNATMFGGAWCNGAEMCGRMIDDKTLQIIADEEYPLAFGADSPKSLGSDSAATNVVIEFSCAFQPFSLSALPAVPDDAKGAVIVVTDEEDPDEASVGELYYAAYDQGANVWRPSGLKSLTNDFVDVSMVISRGDPGFLGVIYTIRGVTIAASLRQTDVIVRDVAYIGMGRACELSADYKNVDPYRIGETEYADFATMNAALKDGDTVIVQLNDTLPAGATLSKRVTFKVGRFVLATLPDESLTNAADIVFTATAAANLPPFFIRTDCTLTLPSGTAFEDYSLMGEKYARVRIDGNEWVLLDGKWQSAGLVTMNFYYPGYFGGKQKLTLEGQLGKPVEYDLLVEYDESICQDDFLQKFYWDGETETLIDYVYWYDDTKWSDAPTNGNAVAFPPTRYVAGDFYPGSTSILYRITYELGVADATHGNPTRYAIGTPVRLGDASARGWTFEGWTNALGQSVTTVDPVALGVAAARAAGTDAGWLYDITLYASWSPRPQATSAPAKMKTAMFAPGKTAAYYDTDEQAQTAAAAVNADETGGVLPPAKYTGDRAAYSANFKATANGSTVAVDLTDSAKEKIASKVDSAALSAAAGLTDPGVSTLTIDNVEPGFYYTVVGGTDLEDVATEGRSALANGTSVELTKPDLGNASKAFYKIKAAVK